MSTDDITVSRWTAGLLFAFLGQAALIIIWGARLDARVQALDESVRELKAEVRGDRLGAK